MNQHLSHLSEAEYQKLKDAFAQVTVLIAGADGSIEEEEKAWAEKVTKIRSYKMIDSLKEFYGEVNNEFDNKLSHYSTQDAGQLKTSLAELNQVLAKLDVKHGAILYTGLKSFANHVAKATGGFFGFFSVNKEEKALLSLPMLNPIIDPEAEQEEE